MTEQTQKSSIPLPTDLSQTTINEPAAVDGNPLAQYFRHPKAQIELPTGGNFWPEGSLELKEGNQLDIMPMTARDEIMMKSPEGLLSGSSIVETIISCVPGIKDAWAMPAHDIDTVLIAIRLASYTHELEIISNCTHCGESNENKIDLRILLDEIPKGKIKNVFKIGDLTFELKPYDFRFVNANNKAKFDQEQLAKTIVGTTMSDEERKEYFESMFSKLADHNVESLVVAIHKISMTSGTIVTDKIQIKEFIDNASRGMIDDIRNIMKKMNETAAIRPTIIKCDHCEKDYEKIVEFNQSNFFE